VSDPIDSATNAPSQVPGARLPDENEPDPAPERERPTAAEVETATGRDRGGTGEPVGGDNIREGRVDGLLGGAHQSQGQGQGG
jgi:hypothetical protein